MNKLINTDYSAPNGCEITVRGVIVRIIAGDRGVTLEMFREDDVIPLIEEFLSYVEED